VIIVISLGGKNRVQNRTVFMGSPVGGQQAPAWDQGNLALRGGMRHFVPVCIALQNAQQYDERSNCHERWIRRVRHCVCRHPTKHVFVRDILHGPAGERKGKCEDWQTMRTERMNALYLVPVIIAAIVNGADAAERNSRTDEALIWGSWRFEDYRENGQPLMNEFIRNVVFQISQNRLSVEVIAENESEPLELTSLSCKFRLDTTKAPRHLDVTIERKEGVRTNLLVYSLDKDTLVLCGTMGQYEQTRPQKIPKTTEEEDGLAVAVLKRLRPKDNHR
jgi:uncharacterized protein (TIGR03067 family)